MSKKTDPAPAPAPASDTAAVDRFPVGTKVAYIGGKPRGVVTGRDDSGVCVEWTTHFEGGPREKDGLKVSGSYREADLILVPTERPD